MGMLSKVIAKLCQAAGLPGHYSNHSLRSTTATRLYDQNLDEQQISEITGHKSVAIRNYKRILLDKQRQISEVLYGKKPKVSATSMITSEEASFDLGMNSQVQPVKMEVNINPTVNVNVSKVAIDTPVVNIHQLEVTVSPVINLNAADLVKTSDGMIQLLSIKVTLTININ